MASTSHMRAFVQWKEPTIFSGEEIECIITFKNTAKAGHTDEEEAVDSSRGLPAINNTTRSNGAYRPRVERQRTVTQSTGISRGQFSTAPSTVAPNERVPSFSRGHRPTLSLSVVPSPVPQAHSPLVSTTPHVATGRPASFSATIPQTATERPARPKHSRSLSILSMRSDAPSPVTSYKTPPTPSRRPARGHGRSASVQVVSSSPGPVIAFASPRHSSPLQAWGADTPPLSSHPQGPDYMAFRPNRRTSGPNTPAIHLQPTSKPQPEPFPTHFTFPAQPSPSNVSHTPIPDFEFPPRDPIPIPKPNRQVSHERLSAASGSLNPISRIISDTSASGTPRSSGSEFYSFSNNSTDTVSSEALAQASRRSLPNTTHIRQPSRNRPPPPTSDAAPELLMMGYAQTMGSFTLDGSLVNQAPFEHVKRKGVLGGEGSGGVVGVEKSKRESRLFGGFGWGNIGESIGGLLGGPEMSSIKEMRGVASTKTIPLLSTPQSILFVDLRLAPGQTRSYTYRFQLPRGLPPTHKGRAIKVQYHIKIGVQRSGSLTSHQNVKHIDVPFRVLGSVNSRGESLGHDLMSPYILLHDRASTTTVPTPDDLSFTIPNFPAASSPTKQPKTSSTALDDFLDYAEHLLAQPPSGAEPLLSPTSENPRRRSSIDDPSPSNMKEAIDVAILRSNLSSNSSDQPSQSTNRFTIARAGQQVAVLSMLRPAYRLGETVTGVLDFSPPADSTSSIIPTYSLEISLETTEHVDPSLALRSASSVQRATRKVYAHVSETVLFARQTSFRLEIPISATPTFETTGVSLTWRLRVEFVTAKSTATVTQQNAARGLGISGGSEDERLQLQSNDSVAADSTNDLLEEVGRDERGVVLIAKERLVAESFEVAVPIRVYGVSGLGAENALGNGVAEPLEV